MQNVALEISLDWLLVGDGVNLKPHLTKQAPGKIALLPVMTREHRERRLAAVIISSLPSADPAAVRRVLRYCLDTQKFRTASARSNVVPLRAKSGSRQSAQPAEMQSLAASDPLGAA